MTPSNTNQASKPVRVLVVDDYATWHGFVANALQDQREMEIVGHASDGAEAVEKAQQLSPDVILLDIGLPKLNGIEAARRIRAVSPRSRVLFVSENRSVDIAKEALSTGAHGYVIKSDAGSDLLPAIKAVLEGKCFVSSSLSRYLRTDPDDAPFGVHHCHDAVEAPAPEEKVAITRHEVGFYSDDQRFLDHVTGFIEEALRLGNAVIVVATKSHMESLLSKLQTSGPDVRDAIAQGRYVPLDADEALSMVMVDDVLDPVRFLQLWGDLLGTAGAAGKGGHPHVSVFGECVHLLWAEGNGEAAIQIEKLTNQLIQTHDVDILCGYSLSQVEINMDHHLFQRICIEHSGVYTR